MHFHEHLLVFFCFTSKVQLRNHGRQTEALSSGAGSEGAPKGVPKGHQIPRLYFGNHIIVFSF